MKYRAIFRVLFPSLVILSALLAACTGEGKKSQSLYPYGWPRSNDEHFDTLSMQCERFWYSLGEYGETDSLERTLDEMKKLANTKNRDEMWARVGYWRGRLLSLKGYEKEAEREFQSAEKMARRAGDLYTITRIEASSEPDWVTPDIKRCSTLMCQSEIMHRAGDLPYYAGRLMELGVLLVKIGDPKAGLGYLERADSLFGVSGHESWQLGNRINISDAMAASGDSVGATEILHSLLQDSLFVQNPAAVNIALSNRYVFGHDVEALHRAYQQASVDSLGNEAVALSATFIADEFLKREKIDSARYYAGVASKCIQGVDNYSFLQDYYRTMAQLSHQEKNYQAEAEWRRKAWENHALLDNESEAISIVRSDFQYFTERQNIIAEANRKKRAAIRWSVVGLLLLLACGISATSVIRSQRQKLKIANAELDLQKSRRKLMAMKLVIESQKNGEVVPAEMQEDFITVFSETNPGYVTRFREQYPSSTDSDIRLAVLLNMGIDNKQIARILGIRTDSVKQARWRLRQHMGLQPGQKLEEAVAWLRDTDINSGKK